MALINAVVSFRGEGSISHFDMHGPDKATIYLVSGDSITIAMSPQYIISATEVRASVATDPKPTHFIVNAWDRITPEASEEAENASVELVLFKGFSNYLKKRVGLGAR